jgi:hypothetical protein
MKDTCKKGDCKFGQLFENYKDCPLYVITNWKEEKDGSVCTIEDCSSIRNILMLSELLNHNVGLHKAFNEQRNELEKTKKGFVAILSGLNDHFKFLKESEKNGYVKIQSTEEKD